MNPGEVNDLGLYDAAFMTLAFAASLALAASGPWLLDRLRRWRK